MQRKGYQEEGDVGVEVFTSAGFKTCQACGRAWFSRKDYLAAVLPIVFTDAFGMSLYNCPCGTTHGFDVLEMWPERQEEILRIWGSDKDYNMAAYLHHRRVMKDFKVKLAELRERYE